ncbi:hypothetical protein DITRI_Ditri19aG0128200 [Diplodiscus trichospermus]
MSSPPKPFKFFNFWSKHPSFLQVVEDSWLLPVEGNPMEKLHLKLKRLKPILKEFNFKHFGGISSKVAKKRSKLAEMQKIIFNSAPATNMIVKEQALSKELHDLLEAEESFYRQKSRVSWIQEAIKLSSFSEISDKAVNFFQPLFGAKDPQVLGCPKNILEELTSITIPPEAIIPSQSPRKPLVIFARMFL